MILLAGVLASVASWFGGNTISAADEPAAIVLQMNSMPARDNRGKPLDGQYWITVTLTTQDGRYVAGRTIQIVEPVEFFGRRDSQLGTAVTDETGYAAVVFQPSQPGEHRVVARFNGDSQYAKSVAELVFEASNVISPFVEEDLPLVSVGRNLSLFLGALGIAFWAFVLVLLGRTVLRISMAPRQTVDELAAVPEAQVKEVRI
jgi:hypothetical protein